MFLIPVTLAPDHATLCFLTYITCRIFISTLGCRFRSQTIWSDTDSRMSVSEPITNRCCNHGRSETQSQFHLSSPESKTEESGNFIYLSY